MAKLKQNSAPPIPSIVIALDRSGVQIARPVQEIYLRSDEQRKAVTEFIAAGFDTASASIQVASLDDKFGETGNCHEDNSSDTKQPAAAYQSAVHCAPEIKSRLEQALHDLRTHERLIAGGWQQFYDVPINIFLLADACDHRSAGMVFPWIAILHQITQENPLCSVFLLFNIAVFPDSSGDHQDDKHIQVSAFLNELDQLLQYRSQSWQALHNQMMFPSPGLWMPVVYLFDQYKEGTYMVKDSAELQIMMGNALLALMLGNAARHFTRYHDEHEIYESQSFYNSIGASALIFDPQSLQNACAHKVICDFLDEKILADTTDRQIVLREAENLQSRVGTIYQWLGQVISPMPAAIAQVQTNPESLAMEALLANFSLSPLDYEQFHQTPWPLQFNTAWDTFQASLLPGVDEAIKANTEIWVANSRHALQEVIDRLPLRPDIYPNGLGHASQILDTLAKDLTNTQKKLTRLKEDLPQQQAQLASRQAEFDQQMRQILTAAPPLPRVIQMLPLFLRQWLAPLYYLRRYARQIQQLQSLKQTMLQLLWKRAGFAIQELALKSLLQTLPEWLEMLARGIADYKALHDRFQQTRERFPDSWGEFPLGDEQNAWHEIFRIPAVTIQFANWSFDNWHPELSQWVVDLFETSPLFTNWRDIDADAISGWLLTKARQAYKPLWQFNLEDILERLTNEGSDPLAFCMQTSLPLLRTDFDAIGGTRISFTGAYGLLGKPEWEACKLPASMNTSIKWETVFTDDPFIVICAQVRHIAPLRSFIDLHQRPGSTSQHPDPG
ncbi:MAG: hypothetical protein ISS57_09295 [Anaerolineales bacterium]|nr:hypothetical protein [Anaerolineales bacterium]